jgi:GxxExxY protein
MATDYTDINLKALSDEFIATTINYLTASKLRVALIINFGNDSLEWKRIIL